MREPENIRAVEQLDIDWMGFILYPLSPRFVDTVPEYMPHAAKRVGVSVGMPVDALVQKQRLFGFDILQLHGNETIDYCNSLRRQIPPHVQIVKTIPVSSEADLIHACNYTPCVDYLLFETPNVAWGGSGKQFEWTLLNHYTGSTPFLIAGGLGPDSINMLNRFSHPGFIGIDLNSKVETAPGVKDVEKIREVISRLRDEGLGMSVER